MRKYRNGNKPFLNVRADDYIVKVTGPHPSRTTNVHVMQDIIQNHGNPNTLSDPITPE